MIRNLRETTRQNIEQDWLKTNRERFTRMLQGQRDLADVSSMILSELAPLVSAQHGVFYSMTNPPDGASRCCELQAGYGYEERKHLSTSFRLGEGLVGQCAQGEEADPADRRPRRLRPDQLRPRRARRRSTSSCCRSCSKERCGR